MPKFRNVVTSLAISTALAGGTLTLAATTATTAAAATTPASVSTYHGWGGWGWGHGCRGRNCNKNKLRNQNANLNYWRPTHIDRHRFQKTDRHAVIFAGPDAVVDFDGDDDFD
ncbi:hypothetical protein ACFHYQ_25940 [Sphaerimonospora cavernae]|uniref:Lactococcin 972 family bacteriocin n=1 Tax=Sphaerimonospora cavernae TaxID=1740611 RepID=A0ABV6UC90_9ACTN